MRQLLTDEQRRLRSLAGITDGEHRYSDDQPRDPDGKFSSGGGGLSKEKFNDVMSRQPNSPDSMDDGKHPFLCATCGDPITADRIGYINEKGLPAHTDHVSEEKLQSALSANKGNGYSLDKKYFPNWPSAK